MIELHVGCFDDMPVDTMSDMELGQHI